MYAPFKKAKGPSGAKEGPASHALILGRITDRASDLGPQSRKKVIGNSQHRFYKCKSYLTKPHCLL